MAVLAAREKGGAVSDLSTGTIPIVMAGAGDPVGTGLVASMGRPGGNVIGVSLLGQEIIAKALDLLRELLPRRAASTWWAVP